MTVLARVLVLLPDTSLIAGCSNLTTVQQRALSGGALLAITGGPILLGAGAVTGR